MAEVSKLIVNDDHLVIKRKDQTRSITAKILGRDVTASKITLYLDRRVHKVGETQVGDFHCSGAITTILTQTIPNGVEEVQHA